MRLTIALVSVLLFAGTACAGSNQPQLDLPTESITIDSALGPQRFKVQLATEWSEQETGLMYRKQMPPNEGMLFDFHQPQMMSFWMKNTLIPLDIVFIRPDGRVLSIARNARPLDETTLPAGGTIRGVLEIAGGRAAQIGLMPGDPVLNGIFQQ